MIQFSLKEKEIQIRNLQDPSRSRTRATQIVSRPCPHADPWLQSAGIRPPPRIVSDSWKICIRQAAIVDGSSPLCPYGWLKRNGGTEFAISVQAEQMCLRSIHGSGTSQREVGLLSGPSGVVLARIWGTPAIMLVK